MTEENAIDTTSTTEPEVGQPEVSSDDIGTDIQHISLKDFDGDNLGPDAALNLMGDLVSDSMPDELRTKAEGEELQTETEVQEDEDSTDETAEDDDDSGDSHTEADDEAEGESEPDAVDTLIVDLNEAEENNLRLKLKLNGEFEELSLPEIQKRLGLDAAATEKFQKAEQKEIDVQRQAAELAEIRRQNQEHQQIMAASKNLATIESRYNQVAAQKAEAEQEGRKDDAYDLDKEMKGLNADYKDELQKAQGIRADAIKNRETFTYNYLSESGERGKKLLEDESYREGFAKFVEGRNLSEDTRNNLRLMPDVLLALAELYEKDAQTKPVKKVKKTLTKTLRGGSNSSVSSKGNPKTNKTLAEKLNKGESISGDRDAGEGVDAVKSALGL